MHRRSHIETGEAVGGQKIEGTGRCSAAQRGSAEGMLEALVGRSLLSHSLY